MESIKHKMAGLIKDKEDAAASALKLEGEKKELEDRAKEVSESLENLNTVMTECKNAPEVFRKILFLFSSKRKLQVRRKRSRLLKISSIKLWRITGNHWRRSN